MKTSIIALSIFAFASAPASADDAFWPNQPNTGTPFNGGGSGDPVLDAANKAHLAALRERIISEGGCNADMLPVWVAQGCGVGAFNTDGGDNGDAGGSSASSGGAAK